MSIFNPQLDRDEFKRIVKTSNRLFKKVDGTQEALLDAKVFKNLTRISKNLIEQVSTATKFSVLDFADKLITYFNVDTQNNEGIFSHHFQKLGKENQHVATSTPYIRFLYGSLEREENTVIIEKKKERQKKVRGDEVGLATQTMIDDGTGNSAEEVSGSSLTEMLVESTMQQLKINFENNERYVFLIVKNNLHLIKTRLPQGFKVSRYTLGFLIFLVEKVS